LVRGPLDPQGGSGWAQTLAFARYNKASVLFRTEAFSFWFMRRRKSIHLSLNRTFYHSVNLFSIAQLLLQISTCLPPCCLSLVIAMLPQPVLTKEVSPQAVEQSLNCATGKVDKQYAFSQ
jgi:hypothetical protein